jgi:hypothetical protein
MRSDKALATALAASLAYVIIVGAVSSNRAAKPMSPHEPVHMRVTLKDTGRVVEIDDRTELASLCMWLDEAFSHPRSLFDMRIFSPPSNQLEITFASGDQTLIYFSAPDTSQRPQPAQGGGQPLHTASGRVILQFDGEYFVAHELPELLLGDQPGVVTEDLADATTDA